MESQGKEINKAKQSPDILNKSLGNESNLSQPFMDHNSELEDSGRGIETKLAKLQTKQNTMSKSLAENSFDELQGNV